MQEEIEGCYKSVDALKYTGREFRSVRDDVCREESHVLFLNGIQVVTLIASPSQLRELGAGFVVSEGLASGVEEVKVSGNTIQVYAKAARLPQKKITESSGGMSMGNPPQKVSSALTLTAEEVFHVISEIVSALWLKTGGAHCSVLYSGGRLIAMSSDVGRHNTIDKVIGFAILNRIDLSLCILGCTGRQPAGMVTKAAHAGVPVIVSKAATTQKGIAIAEEAGVTLIGRVRENAFTIYTHPERIMCFLESKKARKGGRRCQRK
jgi:FdhD protein